MTRTIQTAAVVIIVVAMVVGEDHTQNKSFPAQLAAQKIAKNEFDASEVSLSLVVNQLALLKILTESSTICSLREMELQELRELKSDFQEFKTTTTKKMQNMTEMENEIKARNEETQQALNQVKEAVANLSRQLAITRTPSPLECEDNWSEYHWSCYKVFEIGATHGEATASCRAHGAYLASIGSEGENSFVHGMIVGNTYIGLSDADQEGVYSWQDGSAFHYSRWRSGEPNNYGGDQDCAYLDINSYWDDCSCGWTHQAYICEKRLQ